MPSRSKSSSKSNRNVNNYTCNYDKNNVYHLLIVVLLVLVIVFLFTNNNGKKNNDLTIENNMVKDKYDSLVNIMGKPTYIEKDGENKLNSATWMSPLNNFHGFGKFGGCDVIKIHGYPSKKYHPHPAIVFLIVGKYIHVPEHLFGPLKYASETINIEQLFIPQHYADKYQNTGKKELALVTGSCASVIISAITVQFAMDMIQKYKNKTNLCLELYEEFRNEYDRRIDDYLCGRGITDKIDWFNANYFKEPEIYNIGEEKCKKYQNKNKNKNNKENFDNNENNNTPKANPSAKSS